MMSDSVVLVDIHDNAIGIVPKLQAHTDALLHRAFSIFIFNSKGELLLQQRAFNKYHSRALWSNTCCSHPRPGEDISAAASRRLFEEMGLHCKLTRLFSFLYKADVGGGLTEYEFDHVYAGVCDDTPRCDKLEVAAWRYLSIEQLREELALSPNQFTEWFKISIGQHLQKILDYKKY